jgi:Na+/H+ antiporter NhaD/arsenite permease-like protein
MHTDAIVPIWSVIPFCLLLLCIAVIPLYLPHWWERNRNKGLVAAALGTPVAWWLVANNPSALLHSAHEYVSFIALLGSLFVVAGGIHFKGDLRATPAINTGLLALGAVLANLLGTTGASMVLIRLVLRTNSERKNTAHLPLFFILVVSNCGGLLTPMGDPPLFLGYLRGVPFTWTFRLLPFWLLAVGWLLTVFYLKDRKEYAREAAADIRRDDAQVEPIRVLGWRNVPLLALILGSIFLPSPWRELVMVMTAAASFRLGPEVAHRANEFAFGPIVEVAILFAGIFVTMVPALELLALKGRALGLDAPWQYFLTSGALSSVLDNAPTYLTFLSAAQSLDLANEVVGVPHIFLVAVSLGSVLMGANTYIGNGPNFMVKAIADASGYRTPSFGRYALLATVTLAPLYVVVGCYLAVH